MEKIFAIACLALAVLAALGGAMVFGASGVSGTTAHLGATTSHTALASMCDPADPNCGDNQNQCPNWPHC